METSLERCYHYPAASLLLLQDHLRWGTIMWPGARPPRSLLIPHARGCAHKHTHAHKTHSEWGEHLRRLFLLKGAHCQTVDRLPNCAGSNVCRFMWPFFFFAFMHDEKETTLFFHAASASWPQGRFESVKVCVLLWFCLQTSFIRDKETACQKGIEIKHYRQNRSE